MLFELHQDKTFCKSGLYQCIYRVAWCTNCGIIANMSAQVLVSERGRSFT